MSGSADRLSLLVGVLLAALLLASLPGSARAQATDRRAAYLGAGAAFGFEDFDGVPGGVDIDEAYGFDAWAGYRFVDFKAGT